jgi:hypothetical protein
MTIWCENCGEKNMTAENVRYPGTNNDGTAKTKPSEERPWCNKCGPCSDWCETTGDCNGSHFNKGNRPKNIPIFSTTYVGRAKRHIPVEFFDYYDCTKQRGGTCGSTNNTATTEFKSKCSAGRCELLCGTFDSTEHKEDYECEKKNNTLKFNNNYIGSSKKTEYARYVKRTRGTETFANKKVVSTEVKTRVNCQLNQFPTYCSKNLKRFDFTVLPSSYKDTSIA